MKLRYKVPLLLLVVGIVQGLATGGFDAADSASAHAPRQEEGAIRGVGPLAPTTPTKLCPAGCPHFPGNAAPPHVRAAWMGSAAQRRGLPAELPVMASLVESGMRNLNYGDRDSVGLFQMRVNIWNTGPYAGYPSNPNLQLDWFFDHAQAVKADRRARGLPLTPPAYGEWIADVERPAAQHRGRYQVHLGEAQALLHHAAK